MIHPAAGRVLLRDYLGECDGGENENQRKTSDCALHGYLLDVESAVHTPCREAMANLVTASFRLNVRSGLNPENSQKNISRRRTHQNVSKRCCSHTDTCTRVGLQGHVTVLDATSVWLDACCRSDNVLWRRIGTAVLPAARTRNRRHTAAHARGTLAHPAAQTTGRLFCSCETTRNARDRELACEQQNDDNGDGWLEPFHQLERDYSVKTIECVC